MQRDADAIVCRPTPGDHLEQMKGRVDRPGQSAKAQMSRMTISYVIAMEGNEPNEAALRHGARQLDVGGRAERTVPERGMIMT